MNITQTTAVIISTLFLIAGCSQSGSDTQTVDISFDSPDSGQWTEDEKQYATKLVEDFTNQCKPLVKYWADVESASLRIDAAFPFMEDQGWTRQLYIKVKVKDTTTLIPGSFRAWGHTCHYSLGSNSVERGMFTSKSPCEKLCNAGEYTFLGTAITMAK